MSKMRVLRISRPKGPFELVERETPEPGAGSGAYYRTKSGKTWVRVITTTGQ